MAPTATDGVNGTKSNAPKSVLTISLARYLHGHDVADFIAKDWDAKATPEQQSRFDNQGFNLDPDDVDGTLAALKDRLQEKKWDGVLVGWCSRGNTKFTVLFEKVVNEVVREVVRREQDGSDGDQHLKLMFSDGPDDLVNTTFRAFG
ncbi:hypothetical protein H2200_005473 [Cladophialophora chaetospira]|uniref:Uncharacterized protein n=1 Tax=Cladophialophora chaetospira TaxID=386627 RepID=A0AA39CJW0_9EURO|nr:hypothetical protein H2200_005473 [Cladophialophora chaetospira]